jgi:predicted MPP superfamily phosphohydrolase
MMKSGLKARKLSRRGFFALAGATAGGAGGLAYMRFAESEWLEVNQPVAKVSDSPNVTEIKLLHLSDFHASPAISLEFINEAIDLGASLKPDLVCLTGDFITWKYDDFPEFARALSKLSNIAPAFACLGNHDGGRWSRRRGYSDSSLVRRMLEDAKVQLLHNASTTVAANRIELQLVGLGDLWAQEFDAKTAFAKTIPNKQTIVLSHNPDSKDSLAAFDWKLLLSGHTHGGQCRLPLFGTPFAPVIDHRYVAGLNTWNGRFIHTTKGVGNLHGMRFNCRPEVSLLRLLV